MASPQPDRHTRISNELLEWIVKIGLSGTEFRIILTVWRFTYGFHRKAHILSVEFLSEATSIHPTQVKRCIKSLISKNMLQVVSDALGSRPRKIAFNKDYESWISVADRVPKEDAPENALGNESATEGGTNLLPLGGADLLPKKDKRKSLKKEEIYVGFPPYKEIIDYLNLKTDKRFSDKSKPTRDLINGRIAEGRTLDDFKYVIDVKCVHWLNDPKFNEYLRPTTLFRPTNFDRYLNQPIEMVNISNRSTTFDQNQDLLRRKMEEAQRRERYGSNQDHGFDHNSLPEPPMDG
ncbi:MAG: conserved phage C-terminal domain-containing protein [Candidatus Cohnella colombiensis]|uniref:Conserved phage C-terminal domain-containing protein n=1 Tax=Candidatus Cohnella colombiensis TaxID=3121368 RepID=A0AA95J9G5_9BACL|nr:MAG: conserved phage C-terminal domain-containing protein [Cohnella sp.]